MLRLENIKKDYIVGEETLPALKGISATFREHEFVSILGPSGCGKTTLLNIIGGLDRYTSGDLVIDGVSTKNYTDYHWDTYRNHRIGFIFQSYNLIPHQTVLKNVQLALTISGVSEEESKARAAKALERVGLGDQVNKKPNQLSGGQMQRVAIARALINDPEIILADEPTGALDSKTSVQIMELLKEISGEKLIVMVTHNPELAEQYSNRIIRLQDGLITDDTNPYEEAAEEATEEKKTKFKVDMSFKTAFMLSLNNLLTKKGRTFLTAFAGSIGIIGIALILSLSSGFQTYIDNIEESTLSSYPVQIEAETADFSARMGTAMSADKKEAEREKEDDKIYANSMMSTMVNNMLSGVHKNDLGSFKQYLEKEGNEIRENAIDIQYNYGANLNIYSADTSAGLVKSNPSPLFDDVGIKEMYQGTMFESMYNSRTNIWKQLIGDASFVGNQYNVVAGKLPTKYDEVVLLVNKNNEISDYTLYTLGILDQFEFKNMVKKVMNGETDTGLSKGQDKFEYTDFLGKEYAVVPSGEFYKKVGLVYQDRSGDEEYVKQLISSKSVKVKIVGVAKAKEESISSMEMGSIGYLGELGDYILKANEKTEAVRAQRANPQVDILTGAKFDSGKFKITKENNQYYLNGEAITTDNVIDLIKDYVPAQYLSMMKASISKMSNAQLQRMIPQVMDQYSSVLSNSTLEDNLRTLGAGDTKNPTQILIYAKDFESKEAISDAIEAYNKQAGEAKEIQYTDYIGTMLDSVSKIVNIVSYVLIAFVAISLVVSSIMIGIITYISVLERTKEIGILRAIGASKRDISNVFNAETMIVGLCAGVIGIVATVLLDIPINLIIAHLSGIHGVAKLPILGVVALILISVFLTFIAGLIPAKMAAKKDPVIALRTE